MSGDDVTLKRPRWSAIDEQEKGRLQEEEYRRVCAVQSGTMLREQLVRDRAIKQPTRHKLSPEEVARLQAKLRQPIPACPGNTKLPGPFALPGSQSRPDVRWDMPPAEEDTPKTNPRLGRPVTLLTPVSPYSLASDTTYQSSHFSAAANPAPSSYRAGETGYRSRSSVFDVDTEYHSDNLPQQYPNLATQLSIQSFSRNRGPSADSHTAHRDSPATSSKPSVAFAARSSSTTATQAMVEDKAVTLTSLEDLTRWLNDDGSSSSCSAGSSWTEANENVSARQGPQPLAITRARTPGSQLLRIHHRTVEAEMSSKNSEAEDEISDAGSWVDLGDELEKQ